jgi:hypothetical protein
MNYYEERLVLLDKEKLPKEVFGDGRDNRMENEEFWKILKVGDKIYPTAWFLRNVPELDKVADIAANGLTIIEKGYIDVREGTWKFGRWEEARFNCLWFEETARPMSFQYVISQQIWKIEKK